MQPQRLESKFHINNCPQTGGQLKCAGSLPAKSANCITLPGGPPGFTSGLSRQRDAVPVRLYRGRGRGRVMPHAKSTEEGEVITAEARVFRQPFQLARIAAADD